MRQIEVGRNGAAGVAHGFAVKGIHHCTGGPHVLLGPGVDGERNWHRTCVESIAATSATKGTPASGVPEVGAKMVLFEV